MEQAHRPALADHVHRIAPMGTRVLINGTWYNSVPELFTKARFATLQLRSNPHRRNNFWYECKRTSIRDGEAAALKLMDDVTANSSFVTTLTQRPDNVGSCGQSRPNNVSRTVVIVAVASRFPIDDAVAWYPI